MAEASFNSVPIIDLAPWFAGAAARNEVAQRVRKVCEDVGFLYVTNHGVQPALVERAFEVAHEFFNLPEAEKLKLHYAKTGGHRGYLPLQAESTDPTAKSDFKEAFDCGMVLAPIESNEVAHPRMTAPNLWPDNLPRFKEVVELYFDSVCSLARTMFQIFAVSFGMSEEFFDDKIDRPIATLRLLHYPSRSRVNPTDHPGIGAHADYECFTILAQDEIGGLQVQNRGGEWIEVPPIPSTFVINIGEMLARWTNDLFRATPHRVVNAVGHERYSIPFFFATNNETMIECLDSCSGQVNPPKYPPVTAGDYLAGRLKEIYGV